MRIVPSPVEGIALPSQSETIRRVASVRTLTLDLATARDKEVFRISGTSLWALDYSGAADSEIQVFFSEDQSIGIPFGPGQSIGGIPFADILISNEAQAGKTLVLAYSTADISISNKADIAVSVGSPLAFDEILSSDRSSYTAGTGTLIAANPSRKYLIITPEYISGSWTMRISTTDPATIDDWLIFYYQDQSAVAATNQGISRNNINQMRPVTIFTTAALYYNIGSNNPTLCVTEFG